MKELKKFWALTVRNMKCYFKDKFLFFVSPRRTLPMLLSDYRTILHSF